MTSFAFKRLRKGGPLVALAAFYLSELSDQLSSAIDETGNRCLLRV